MPVSEIAKEIYRQINGRRLSVMTGAKDFIADGDSLQFSFPQAKDGINRCKIAYDYGKDLYTVTFGRVAKKNGCPEYTLKQEYTEVYFDMFDDLFESTTGLYVHL